MVLVGAWHVEDEIFSRGIFLLLLAFVICSGFPAMLSQLHDAEGVRMFATDRCKCQHAAVPSNLARGWWDAPVSWEGLQIAHHAKGRRGGFFADSTRATKIGVTHLRHSNLVVHGEVEVPVVFEVLKLLFYRLKESFPISCPRARHVIWMRRCACERSFGGKNVRHEGTVLLKQ